MRRVMIAIGFAALLAALVAVTASGAKPVRELIPAEDEFVVDDCGFDVRVQVEGRTIRTSFFDREGNFIRQTEVYPGFRWVFTNVATGETAEAVITGPAFLRVAADGSGTFTGTGPWGWIGEPGTTEPGIFLTQGRFVVTFDVDGNTTSFTSVGRIVDICALLAQ